MDEDDRPRPSGAERQFGAASLLSGESLDPYSRDELNQRIALLEAEIARVKQHRDKAEAHRRAADALFGSKS
jgi:uncharacterized small protein (DUF1192 family)